MADLFFYGTMCHVPLLELVLGRSAAAIDMEPATLPGWTVDWVEGEAYPMIRPSAGAVAQGLLVHGLEEADLARLDHYEGGFGYGLEPVEAYREDGESFLALVFMPDPARCTPAAPWQFDDWVAKYGALTLEAAQEVMERFGISSAAEIDRLFPWIRARGWARQLAADTAPSSLRRGPDEGAYRIEATRPGFEGFFRLRAFDLSFRRFDGAQSDTISREVFISFDAALVLPYDPVSDRILLIEQLRYGPIWRNDPAPWVLEPVAGLVEAGENPADCARREAVEEARIKLGALEPIARVYASPGYSTEFFHCFLGVCDLSDHNGGLAGVAQENEDIRSHVIDFDRAMALVDSGEVNVGPLAMMLLWLARHRDRLRRQARVARP